MTHPQSLRVKIPCSDEAQFMARLGDHVAAAGLRVPTPVPQPVGSTVRVALEFRDGGILDCDGVVDAHVQVDGRAGVNVRFTGLGGGGDPGPASALADEPLGAAPAGTRPALDVAIEEDEPLYLFDEAPAQAAAQAAAPPVPFTSSTEIAAAMAQRGAHVRRGVVVAMAVAVPAAAAALLLARGLGEPLTPAAAATAHVAAADRLLAQGRGSGRGGAVERLLAARRLVPGDPGVEARLSRVADALESLGTRALERGELAVAVIHLENARVAAPDRPSIRAKLERIARRTPAGR